MGLVTRGQKMQRPSVTMEAVRDLTCTLWTIRTNQETARIFRTTQSILRFFLFFDICYLISGIALVTMALANQMEERNRMVVYGGLFGLFASVPAVCNFLASHGLRTWRRSFLLPWLFFFLLVIGLLTMNIIRDLWCHHIQWRHVFLFFATMFIFTSWRHMQKQFLVMSLPRPFPISPDVEAVVREALQPLPVLPKDAPPRYEEVQTEELPPGYDEATSRQLNEEALS